MGNTVDSDFEGQYQQRFEEAVAYLKIRGIPWVSVGGVDREGQLTREQKITIDRLAGSQDHSFNTSLSLTANSTTYTQRVPVYNSDGTSEVMGLWILDSLGSYGCKSNYKGKSCIPTSDVDWFKQSDKKTINDLVFTTNPVPEMMKVANDCKFQGHQH